MTDTPPLPWNDDEARCDRGAFRFKPENRSDWAKWEESRLTELARFRSTPGYAAFVDILERRKNAALESCLALTDKDEIALRVTLASVYEDMITLVDKETGWMLAKDRADRVRAQREANRDRRDAVRSAGHERFLV